LTPLHKGICKHQVHTSIIRIYTVHQNSQTLHSKILQNIWNIFTNITFKHFRWGFMAFNILSRYSRSKNNHVWSFQLLANAQRSSAIPVLKTRTTVPYIQRQTTNMKIFSTLAQTPGTTRRLLQTHFIKCFWNENDLNQIHLLK